MEYFAAFTLGLFGSLHCVGMCGPLMLAVDAGAGWRGPLPYQAGRILTYALLGAVLGSLGLGMRMWNAQGYFSLLTGAALIAVALFKLDPGGWLLRNKTYGRFQLWVRKVISGSAAGRGKLARFGLGCCNGLLPCGLVYLAVVGAAGTGSILSGSLFMVSFGMGTLPLLLVTIWSGRKVISGGRGLLARWSPVVVLLSGLILIYRGWYAAVPLDYQVFQDMLFPVMCH